MIPDLPKSCSQEERLDFYSKLLGNLDDQSAIHSNWHTHRQNPSTCWICDLLIISKKILYVADSFLSKSVLDIETELSSENDSDAEIEDESLNNDDEQDRVPEYDTVESEL